MLLFVVKLTIIVVVVLVVVVTSKDQFNCSKLSENVHRLAYMQWFQLCKKTQEECSSCPT